LHIGEDTFSRKYEDRYVRQMSFSTEHEKSLNRLRTLPGKQYNSYFQGEVLSGLLAPLITQEAIDAQSTHIIQRLELPRAVATHHLSLTQ